MKYVLLGVAIALWMLWWQGKLSSTERSPVFASPSANIAQGSQYQLRSYARSLTIQGHELLNHGKAEDALKTWEKATAIYTKLAEPEGITGSQINQSLALQALGQYRRACTILLSALKLDYQDNLVCKQPSEMEQSSQEQLDTLKKALEQQETVPIRVTGLRILGDVLRVIGNLEESQEVLQQSLKIAERIQSSSDISANLLSLGNTKHALYNQGKDLYERTESTNYRDDALNLAENSLEDYQEAAKYAANLTTSKLTQIQAQLNRLSLLLEYKKWLTNEGAKRNNPEIENRLNRVQFQIQPLVDELLNEQFLFFNLPPIQAIYSRLNFATSLIQIPAQKEQYASIAIQHAKEALQQAQELGNKRAEAYALGILGSLYEQAAELSLAQKYTEEGVLLAQAIQAEDIAYQWQWQLGRIYKQREENQAAIAAYDAAVKSLDSVRQNLLYVNTDLLFSFREKVEPVYRELISLYLKEPSEENLKKVIEVNKRFQLTELENFLQCNLLDSVPLEQIVNQLEQPPAAILYTIVLEKQNQIEVVVSLPQQSQSSLYHYSVPWHEVISNVTALRNILQQKNLRNLNPNDKISPWSQNLYKLLLAPAKSYLPKEGTLLFVLDSQLQNIPMALLQDENQRYLVEDYNIALTLGSQIRKPKFFPWKQSKALVAGVSYSPISFPPEYTKLDYVETELVEVEKNTDSSEKLSNENFTLENFTHQVNVSAFPIIHLATHGQFSSNAEETVILAYNKRINVRQLDRLLRSKAQGSLDTIELLVLSACQTAKGDKRGGLGIAGVAVQAGARSTVASLWSVSDKSTALFMKEFYQRLKAGATKAEALRQAQLAFLKNTENNPQYKGYEHPYYWAAFVLAGNWL